MDLCVETRKWNIRRTCADVVLQRETNRMQQGFCITRKNVAILYHGVFGMALWHFAAYLGDNVVVEFSTRGMMRSALHSPSGSTHFQRRALRAQRRCPSVQNNGSTCIVCELLRSVAGIPCARHLPTLATVEQRVSWLMQHVTGRDYDLVRFNCEHATRYILTGNAVSTQALIGRAHSPLAHRVMWIVTRCSAYRDLLAACSIAVVAFLVVHLTMRCKSRYVTNIFF